MRRGLYRIRVNRWLDAGPVQAWATMLCGSWGFGVEILGRVCVVLNASLPGRMTRECSDEPWQTTRVELALQWRE